MKLLIDKAECDRQKIPMSLAMYLASLYHKEIITDVTFHDACNRGLMEYDGFDMFHHPINPKLTPKGIELVEGLFLNSEFRREGETRDRFDDLAVKLMELYPEGRKKGSSLNWRETEGVISQRLKSLMKNKDLKAKPFTDEEAIEATKRYVQSFNGDYQYMQVLKYFIIKKNLETGETSSQLLSWIKNKGEEATDVSWMDSVR